MDHKAADAFAKLMKDAAKTHPLFAGIDPEKTTQMTEEMTKTLQAMLSPQGMAEWMQSWMDYQTEMAQLWQQSLSPSATEPSKDTRFKADDWNEGVFPFLRQSYALTAKAMADFADKAGLPEHEQRKLSFYTRVAADALSPSNYALTNPEVIKLAQETKGQSLVDGFKNMLADLEKGYITTTDEAAFTVGGNLANTPGSVILRNDLFELIQYQPRTDKVRSNPVLIIPPCVNKFYIFDINEKKSMIRYMLDQGHTVFTIAWRNPGPETRDLDWNDYLRDGIFAALDVTTDIVKGAKVDLLSWCNGGTMLLAALAVMTKDQKAHVGTATFLSSMIDFADPGQVEVFIDQPQLQAYNKRLETAGVAPGRDIAAAMAMLHVNESIWGFVIGNYLKGKSPPPFDILYWNADTSNLPAKWYAYYTEEMYLANKLREPGALTLLDTPVDTRNIDVACYFVAATADHIVPWKTSYAATGLVSGDTEFVLTTGGHVSGTVINHPERNRRYFLTEGDRSQSPEDWQAAATRTEGSWWPHWLAWLAEKNNGTEQAAPATLGNRTHKALAAAPGTYVLEQVSQQG
ncbi:PHA/PHB synthase family protein [Pseudorhodobacter turbinis]|nr:alpha/beta fold hydrolase [Pseudorhodobacter turbinis]